MYLSELEIVGFKSFGQKTTFKFTDGITAVVGPNGCGKSNVVDAIRWVLGEQKSNVLRSDSMGNVIFNGSKNRKAVGMAEVTMTIENNKNVLPSDYTQVSICRRLFKNGDSKYLLNKTNCRLKDITELFMDTGLGPDSYSVIELKMVESIISVKNDERRFLFEEAAGVTKYKQRRKEAERRLKSVEEDLNRVKDIVAEVEKNVNSLGRQAAKTRRYNKLIDELKEYEILFLKAVFLVNAEKLNKFNTILEDFDAKRRQADNDLSEKEKFSVENKEKLDASNKNYDEKLQILNRTNSELSELKQRIAVDSEKYNSISNSKGRIEQEIKEAKDTVTGQKNRLEKLEQEIKSDESQLEKLDSDFISKKDEYKEKENSLFELKRDADKANQLMISSRGELNITKSKLNASESRITSIDTKIEYSKKEISNLRVELEKQKSEKEVQTAEAEKQKQIIKVKEQNLIEQEKSKKELEDIISEMKNQLNEEKNKVSHKKGLLNFLNSLIDNKSKIPFFKKSNEWQIKDMISLGEMAGTDKKYRIAVQSALGEYADFVVLDKKEDITKAFSLLDRNNKGKENFICTELIEDLEVKKKDKELTYVSDIIRSDDKISSLLDSLLEDTAVFEDLEQAQKAIDEKKCSRAITLKGEITSSLGMLKGGGVLKGEGELIGRQERIKLAQKEISELDQIIEKLNKDLQEENNKYNQINLHQLKNEIKQSENKFRQIDNQLSQFEIKINSKLAKIDLINDTIGKADEEKSEINIEIISINKQINELRIMLGKSEENFNQVNAELKIAEEKVYSLNREQRDAELKLVQLKTNYRNKQHDSERISSSIRNIEKRNQNRQDELFNSDNIIQTIKDNQVSNKKSKQEKEHLLTQMQSDLEFFKNEIKVYKEQAEEIGQELNAIRIFLSKVKDDYHHRDLDKNEVKIKVEQIMTQAQEKYDIELVVEKIKLPEDFEASENETIVREIKNKLANIGNVNFLALDEYETQNERLTFYTRQIDDLENAQDILSTTIEEINETAEKKFVETFEQIRVNFKELFNVLFDDETGSADIELGEGNPLEAAIEIKAKPPGKKTPALSMLSTGEKTLVAISLLFAIYLVKPSPLCILDEVDAPLDDANIGRFINLIKRFSDNTQFLVVTHNKKTMQAADNLYGVTMQEQGLSKVVSVQFNNKEGINV